MYVDQDSAKLTVSGGEIRNNTATNVDWSNGGGVYVGSGTATVVNTQIIRNTANSNGGGVYVREASAKLTVSGGEIRNNTTNGDGGGVHVYVGTATMASTQIISNTARYGGGVYVVFGTATMTNTQIISNTATDFGGGVYVGVGTATMTNTQIISNTARYGGGVVVGQDSAKLTASGSEIRSNTADRTGGGVYVDWGTATMTNTQIIGNTAKDYDGGGVYVNADSAKLTASGSEIRSNTARYGGGVYVNWGTATMMNTQVISNTANNQGGGVYVSQSTARLSVGGGPIADNVAPSGSGVYQNDGIITPTTPLTITGQIYQQGGTFAGSSYDLRVEGSLDLAGGDFYAPDTPNDFVLTGPFTHTGGVYHQTQVVNGSSDVEFPKAGGVIINAEGQDLGSTEVALTAGADCAGVPVGEAVHHCYLITPTNATGRDATVTFYYRNDEIPAGHITCATLEAYRWDGAWDNRLTRDTSYGADGRLCGDDPQSIQTMNVATFSPFVFVLNTPVADVSITKTVMPTMADPGEVVTFTLTFVNSGPQIATGVIITDIVPVSVTVTSVISSGVAIAETSAIPPTYTWEAADLSVGASGVIIIAGVLNADLPGGHTFTNAATIAGTETDVDTGNNADLVEVTVGSVPSITVTKMAGVDSAEVGETITYTYRVTNTGNVTLDPVIAYDDKLGAVTLDAISLAPDEGTSGTLAYLVVEGDLPGPLVNTVTVTGTPPVGVVVTADASFALTLSVSPWEYIYLPLVVRN